MNELKIKTTVREALIDITDEVRQALIGMKIVNGALLINCPHTTCGMTINEVADPDVCRDLVRFFSEAAPHKHSWLHAEGNSDAHIKSSLLGSSVTVPIQDCRLRLGTWQSIYLYEGDGPRLRSVWLMPLAAQ